MSLEPFPVRYDDNLNCFVKASVKSKGISSFLWESSPYPAKVLDLEFLAGIYTVHPYNAPVFFKPTWQEVISQIPPNILDEVYAFETRFIGFAKFTENREKHRALTLLFKRRET